MSSTEAPASCNSSFSGSHSSSSSRKAIHSPLACPAPRLRAMPGPSDSWFCSTRTLGSTTPSRAARVSGFGPSTTTMTSSSPWVWPSTLASARMRSFGRRVVGMMTETSAMSASDPLPVPPPPSSKRRRPHGLPVAPQVRERRLVLPPFLEKKQRARHHDRELVRIRQRPLVQVQQYVDQHEQQDPFRLGKIAVG